MDSISFVFWLQGALEVSPEMLEKGMTPEQVKTVQDHINLVIKKVTPDRFEEKKKALTLKNLRIEGSSPSTGLSREIDMDIEKYHSLPGILGSNNKDANGNQLFCSAITDDFLKSGINKKKYFTSGCTSSEELICAKN